MTPTHAAARLSLALLPGHRIEGKPGQTRAFNSLATYAKFAREVHAEAGPDELARIVREVERHSALTGWAA